MRILFVNWAPVRFGTEVGGGVNNYSQAMALELLERGHQVCTLSAGFSHCFGNRVFVKRAPDFRGLTNYELVNSPILAPAHFNFRFPASEIHAPELEDVFRRFLAELSPDIVHFQNIEGLSRDCLMAAGYTGAAVFYSLHNYHTVCPQVGLLHQGREICHDFDGGKRCVNCMSPPSFRKIVFLRKISFFVNNHLVFGRRFMKHGRAFRTVLLRLFDELQAKGKGREGREQIRGGPNQPEFCAPAADYARRRAAMVDGLNQCDLLLAVSHFVKELFVGMGVSSELVRVNHIGNKMADWMGPCSDGSREWPAQGVIRLVFLGVVDDLKGLPFVLESLTSLDESLLSRVEFFVYARGIERRRRLDDHFHGLTVELASKMRGLHVVDGYDFDRLPEILSGMDLGVVPPIWYDNAPQVVFEMFALKIPVLGARIGGIPDFVKHDVNGLLFEAGSGDEFRLQLTKIIENPALLRRYRNHIGAMKTLRRHGIELEKMYRKAS